MPKANKKGFMCFLILTAFTAMNMSLSGNNNALDELERGAGIVIAAEKANFERTIIEDNLDFVLLETLKAESIVCGTEPHILKHATNTVLASYFNAVESEEVKFVSSKGGAIDPAMLNRTTSLIVKKQGADCTISYIVHGGIARNEFVTAIIGGDKFSQEFRFPPDYSIEVRGLSIA